VIGEIRASPRELRNATVDDDRKGRGAARLRAMDSTACLNEIPALRGIMDATARGTCRAKPSARELAPSGNGVAPLSSLVGWSI